MYATQHMTTKHAMRQRHQTCAIVYELPNPCLKMSERPIPEPLRKGLIHYRFPCVELLNSFSLVKHRLGMTDAIIQSKEQWVLHRLETFYANPATFARVQSILQGESKLSLRLIDWFVTNYSKKQNVSFLTRDNKHVIVYLVYKAHLKAYNKKMFDPFCRWKRIQFRGLDTTVGQLNFFEWAVQDEVLDYLETHYDEIHADMEACSQVVTNTEEGRRKRHELSRSATKSVRRHDVRVVVSFD